MNDLLAQGASKTFDPPGHMPAPLLVPFLVIVFIVVALVAVTALLRSRGAHDRGTA